MLWRWSLSDPERSKVCSTTECDDARRVTYLPPVDCGEMVRCWFALGVDAGNHCVPHYPLRSASLGVLLISSLFPIPSPSYRQVWRFRTPTHPRRAMVSPALRLNGLSMVLNRMHSWILGFGKLHGLLHNRRCSISMARCLHEVSYVAEVEDVDVLSMLLEHHLPKEQRTVIDRIRRNCIFTV